MKKFQDKVVLVTGGTRGIGFAVAKAFVKEGAKVIIWGVTPERGERAAQELRDEGEAYFQQVNVVSLEEVKEALEEITKQHGSIDILVNSAGITRDKLLLGMKEEDFTSVIDTNLKSVYNTTHLVIKPMIKKRSGRIINISSVLGVMGSAGQTNYCASKFGIVGFSRALAKEIAARGVTVNVIAPGFIDTDMTKALSDDQKKSILEEVPMKCLGQADDVAFAVKFLASEEAKYITGHTLVVDGGLTA